MERLKCQIRTMQTEDEGMLLFLAEESLRPLAAASGHGERYRSDQLVDLLESADVFVAESSEEVAGFAAVTQEGGDLLIECLCINPAFEARAVAHQLLAWIEGLAFNRNAARLQALVPAGDTPAEHLYRGHDFVPAPALDRPEMIVMEKRLPEP
jgi:ribosomal protein S18 acetylase RimI-like enzyme